MDRYSQIADPSVYKTTRKDLGRCVSFKAAQLEAVSVVESQPLIAIAIKKRNFNIVELKFLFGCKRFGQTRKNPS